MFPLRDPEDHHPFVRAWQAFMRLRSAHPEHPRRIQIEVSRRTGARAGPYRDLSAQIRARGQARARPGDGGRSQTLNNEPEEVREEDSSSSSRMDEEGEAGCVFVGFDVSNQMILSFILGHFNRFSHNFSLPEATCKPYYVMTLRLVHLTNSLSTQR